MFEIEIHVAYLVIEGKRTRLTKSLAKQLPVHNAQARWNAALRGEEQPKPLCKIMGEVLDKPLVSWLLLVPDEEAGLAWVAAIQPSPEMAAAILQKGGWVDEVAEVPTVIL